MQVSGQLPVLLLPTVGGRGQGAHQEQGAQWKISVMELGKISVHRHIYVGAQPPAHLRHRHDQVSEARQGLHLQPDQEGGGQHQD